MSKGENQKITKNINDELINKIRLCQSTYCFLLSTTSPSGVLFKSFDKDYKIISSHRILNSLNGSIP